MAANIKKSPVGNPDVIVRSSWDQRTGISVLLWNYQKHVGVEIAGVEARLPSKNAALRSRDWRLIVAEDS